MFLALKGGVLPPVLIPLWIEQSTNRLLSGMDPLVLQEMGPAFEGLPTCHTLEWRLPGVDDGVLQEVGAPVEGLPALRALVGLLPSVDAPVLQEFRAAPEGLPAGCTLIWLLAGVDNVVLDEVCSVAECLLTVLARKGPFSSVGPVVPNEG